MPESDKTLVVHAGTSGVQTFLVAIGATALWYTVDDRLAAMLSSEPSLLGDVPLTMVFVLVLIVAMLFSLAGMSWSGK